MGEKILSLAGILLLMGAILYLAYWCTRRMGGVAGGGLSCDGRGMRVAGRLPLSQDKQVVLVQVGARWLLLGASSAGLQLLAELTEEEAARWAQETDGAEQPAGFREIFLQKLHRRGPRE